MPGCWPKLVLGGVRLSLLHERFRKRPRRRDGSGTRSLPSSPAWSLGPFAAAAAYLCVGSGKWPLILMAGMRPCRRGRRDLVAQRRYAALRLHPDMHLDAALSLATLALADPPFVHHRHSASASYAGAVIFVLFENYKILLDLYRSERENRRLAQHDPLTGLPNRVMKLKRFDELLRGPVSDKPRRLTVFCLDLDGFKDVNDRFGHAAGDALLIALADRLRDSVRTLDFVSRIGGDEFVILLPAISPAEATVSPSASSHASRRHLTSACRRRCMSGSASAAHAPGRRQNRR